MPTPRQFPGTGPYRPPAIVGPMETNPPGYGGGSGGSIATNVLENPKLAGYWDWINTLGKLYPGPVVNRGNLGGPGPIRNNRPVADRQTLTMAASQHPLPNTGPYTPPRWVKPGDLSPGGWFDVGRKQLPERQDDWLAFDDNEIRSLVNDLYPSAGGRGIIGNSQAIGDRPVTTMTNPLPGYSPLTMVKGQAAAQLRTLINHALAQRGLQPLVNTPLPVGATQMGRM